MNYIEYRHKDNPCSWLISSNIKYWYWYHQILRLIPSNIQYFFNRKTTLSGVSKKEFELNSNYSYHWMTRHASGQVLSSLRIFKLTSARQNKIKVTKKIILIFKKQNLKWKRINWTIIIIAFLYNTNLLDNDHQKHFLEKAPYILNTKKTFFKKLLV